MIREDGVEVVQLNVKELHHEKTHKEYLEALCSTSQDLDYIIHASNVIKNYIKPSNLHGKVSWGAEINGKEFVNWYYKGEQCFGGKSEFDLLIYCEGLPQEEKKARLQSYEDEWDDKIKAKITADYEALEK